MAEIKSTLDIVMEKTKHLKLSDEEKQEQDQAEVQNKIKGLIQKFQDMILGTEQLEKEMTLLQDTIDVDIKQFIFDDICQRLDLDRDNSSLLDLLDALCGVDTKGHASLFETYGDEVQTLKRARMIEKKKALADTHFISGSAVVPNLEADPAWQSAAQAIRQKYGDMLAEKKEALMKSH